ncbi:MULTISPECIES: hypothetical protein [Cryobacterium]|nr:MULTISPECIES: hypothetical protein [Cryobacterium]
MTRTNKKPRAERGLAGVIARLNGRLLPWIGPPPLGPYDTVSAEEVQATQARSVCPICGALMSLHEIDRSGERTQVHHPTPEQVAERSA